MIDNTHRHVNGDHREAYESEGIPPLGALGSVTKGKKVAHDEQAKVQVIEDKVDNMNSSDIEALVFHRVRQDVLTAHSNTARVSVPGFLLPRNTTPNNEDSQKQYNNSRAQTRKRSG
jgi:hypothetical protein